ncbi:MAG: pyruvate kinase [Clostridia bacterium]|jgi:pyruvate kinase|uniref:pyruvate kinase n=1 Tax=Petroclostridium xylanilyticum TaxID=1792311 RepID=UPI000B994039|nr:pyruvate kinase [Petroclostridium xylanilyticum]MBZ4644670.1 pyruvate kinase [Clostridia bacterium]
MRKTKIVCTLGPATDDINVLRKLIEKGMNVARLNFSHGSHDDQQKRVDALKKIRDELQVPVALLLDTKGPEIRIKHFKNDVVELKEGQIFTLTTREIEGDAEIVSITYKNLPQDVRSGNRILIDDGLIELIVQEVSDTDIKCEVQNGGKVSNHKGVNVPGVSIKLPYISEKDREDILFGIRNDFDFIAASFVRTAQDVLEVRKILEQNGGKGIQIIAKIENGEGVTNIDDILRVSDGIMVARGDMGVEIPLEELPVIQKMLIEKCYQAGKPVITATQMLDSMIRNPRPTRAETTDIANAIYDGTSAIMLSGETSVGKYPVESLVTMARIARRTEDSIDYKKRFAITQFNLLPNVTNAISHATCTTAHDLGAAAIISVTKSGHTARMVSKFRPACPIIATTVSEKVYRQLALSWGVYPFLSELKVTTDDLFEHAVEKAVQSGIVKNGDLVVITAGMPVGISGTTNILKVHLVGHVLVEGSGVNNLSVSGNVCVAKSAEQALREFNEGDILVISSTSNELLPILKKASGIITEEEGITSHAAIVGMTLDIPVITGAKEATEILKSGTTVTIDSSRGLVYSGVTKVL